MCTRYVATYTHTRTHMHNGLLPKLASRSGGLPRWQTHEAVGAVLCTHVRERPLPHSPVCAQHTRAP